MTVITDAPGRSPEDVREDRELVARIISRRPGGLLEAYARHSGDVYGLARRLRGADEAARITEAVFLSLWARPQRYVPARLSLRAHLLAETHRRAVGSGTLRPKPVPVPDGPSAEGPAGDRDPVRSPAPGCGLVPLAYFGGLSVADIGLLVGRSPRSVHASITAELVARRRELPDRPDPPDGSRRHGQRTAPPAR